jgi:hypothetical protein
MIFTLNLLGDTSNSIGGAHGTGHVPVSRGGRGVRALARKHRLSATAWACRCMPSLSVSLSRYLSLLLYAILL